jgi:Domain of unknown function (DUF1996)
MNFDDPIVYPNQPGKAHLHTFFANTSVNAYTNASNITSTGNSTCTGGTINRSGYWIPSVIDTRDGRAIAPDHALVYYKIGSNHRDDLVDELPVGLRMIAGDPKKTTPSDYWWENNYGWQCMKADTFEEYHQGSQMVPDCAPGDWMGFGVNFPNCWDGVNLDSPDHKSHLTYAHTCPASHPKAIPGISINVRFKLDMNADPSYYRLSSDNYPASSYAGGLSGHADWFNGWKPEFSKAWLDNCDRAGLDCHAHLLGDGREIY